MSGKIDASYLWEQAKEQAEKLEMEQFKQSTPKQKANRYFDKLSALSYQQENTKRIDDALVAWEKSYKKATTTYERNELIEQKTKLEEQKKHAKAAEENLKHTIVSMREDEELQSKTSGQF